MKRGNHQFDMAFDVELAIALMGVLIMVLTTFAAL